MMEMAPIRTMPTVTLGHISLFPGCCQWLARGGFRGQWSPTAGLNRPPLILKKTHALTASEKPKLKLICNNSEGFFCATCVMTVVPVLVFEEIFATLH